jgi:hypothetical protein
MRAVNIGLATSVKNEMCRLASPLRLKWLTGLPKKNPQRHAIKPG